MSDNLVLEHLRAIRAENAELRRGQESMLERTRNLELGIGNLHSQWAELSVRFDSLNARVARIETRLEIQP